jgi:formate hydrogenlyase subunit 4
VPVDDPLTHLELTMIHEVMVLDHSGPELAAMQYAAALKMTLYASLIAALLNPFDPLVLPVAAVLFSLAAMLGVGVAVGCVESLSARLPMRWVPRYVLLASAFSLLAMVLVGTQVGRP